MSLRCSMVCLFHGDYGPADPAFTVSEANGHRWTIDASLLKDVRNIGEAGAIQRHVLKGQPVTWCHQGHSWVDQDAIGWFYIAAFVFVVLPHIFMKVRAWNCRLGAGSTASRGIEATLNPQLDP